MLRLPGLALVLFLASRAGVLDAGEGITGYAGNDGTISFSDGAGAILELAPAAWGPGWAWTGMEGAAADDQGASVVKLGGKLGGTGVPFHLELHARRAAERTLEVSACLTAERDTALTLIILSLTPGDRFHGDGRCLVTSDGADKRWAVPFPRGVLGTRTTRLRLADAGGAAVELAFARPAALQADGSARIVLASERMTGGTRYELGFSITLPADATWYPTPAEVPYPADWGDWFAWQPTAALTTLAAPGTPPTGVGLADWSGAPAGALGRVVRTGDELLLGGKPVKFWGLNNCYGACAPDRDTAVRRAALYARMGINAVRLHKLADGPGWSGIQSPESFAAFDPAGLERLDYYVAQLKARGIYIELSLNFGVHPGPADAAAIPWLGECGQARKPGERVKTGNGSIYLASELQELQIRQMTGLLRHRNPYTGLTYAEDPVVLAIEEFNEDCTLFFGTIQVLQRSPTLRRRTSARFTDWLAKRYGDEAGLARAWGAQWKDALAHEKFTGESFAERSIVPAGNPWYYDPDQLAGSQTAKKARLLDTMRFLYELQNDFYQRYAEAMRAAGYQGEILASNWIAGRGASHYLNLHSDALIGLIDRHNYFDRGSMLTRAGSGILSTGACQVAERPFMLSEWIHTFPNQWGVEGPAIIGAYGLGLQGWDVSFMFQNGDNGGFVPQLGGEWEVTAPQILGLFPAVARQVRRGDVHQSALAATRRVHVPSLFAGQLGFDDQGQAAGDVKQSDSTTIPARSLAVARNVVAFTDTFQETPRFDCAPFEKDGALASSTGELRWYEGADPRIVIDTAGTKAVVGWAAGGRYQLGDIVIAPRTRFAAIYVTACGEQEDLSSAKRLLVTTLARVRNTGMKYLGERLLAKGKAPLHIEPVQVELTLARPGVPTVYACDHDGNRTAATIPVEHGRVILDGARTHAIWYEIVYP